MEESTRKRRTKDEIVKALDEKIQYHQSCIDKLNAKKEKTLAPRGKTRRNSTATILKIAKESGMTSEEIAKKLGIKL